ncbi:MAG: extracellular solute-binding protein [Armatimonadetes bacterium]|nr:extracellular solute-binding protein [Armatimonadota bacterium]
MKARKKVLFYSFILSLVFISLYLIIFPASSAFLDKNKRIITFWHAMDGQRGDILRQLISEFNRNHPKIKVEERFVSSSTLLAGNNYHALYSEILRSLALKQPPNIAQVYENWTTQFIEYNAIVPIENYVKGVNGLNTLELNDIFPVFLDANTFNEKLWTIPFNKSIYVLFYNKDLFSKFNFQVPKTWDELLNIAKKLTFKKGMP